MIFPGICPNNHLRCFGRVSIVPLDRIQWLQLVGSCLGDAVTLQTNAVLEDVLTSFPGVVLFSQAAIHWSRLQYEEQFSRFSNNIGHRSFEDRLCQPLPIDIV